VRVNSHHSFHKTVGDAPRTLVQRVTGSYSKCAQSYGFGKVPQLYSGTKALVPRSSILEKRLLSLQKMLSFIETL
jgi:hypothetical protein